MKTIPVTVPSPKKKFKGNLSYDRTNRQTPKQRLELYIFSLIFIFYGKLVASHKDLKNVNLKIVICRTLGFNVKWYWNQKFCILFWYPMVSMQGQLQFRDPAFILKLKVSKLVYIQYTFSIQRNNTGSCQGLLTVFRDTGWERKGKLEKL